MVTVPSNVPPDMVPPPVVVSSSLLVTELVEENAPPAMTPLLRILPLNVPPSICLLYTSRCV